MRIAVTGSTGNNAAAWTRALLAAGFEVTQLTRHTLPPQPGRALGRRRFDLDDASTYAPAVAEVDVLALITPSVPGQVERELALINAAAGAGVQRIVKLSVIGADLATPI